VPVGGARLKAFGFVAVRTGYSCAVAVLLTLFASRALQNAIAEGETRTISMHHIHTNEDITITYKRDGRYDEAALEKLNWFLRDWRKGQATRMDPHLIDLVWEVQREAGANQPIQVVCGYRSPETNEMLRRHSSGVARFSQHMLGKAMDYYIPGVPLSELRAFGLRLQRGGVGFYPTSGSPFVHMDTGGVRMWPRMTREELVRVFPDGRTVLIPTDGRPLPGYELALADIRKRGSDPSEESLEAARTAHVDVGQIVASAHDVNPFAKLLGLARDDDDEDADDGAAQPTAANAKLVAVAAMERPESKKAARGAAAQPKLTHAVAMASAAHSLAAPTTTPNRRTTPGAVAELTPKQVIATRGYWQGLSEDTVGGQTALKNALRPAASEVASVEPDATGSVTPWSSESNDHASPELALSYAEQAAPGSPSQAVAQAAAATRDAAEKAGQLISQNDTTIAVKGIVDQPHTSVQRAFALASAAVKVGIHRDSPWLRAVILSPSVHRFLTTLALGANDFTTLAALMVKPASSVMMTFSSDPSLGLTDHFTGSAIVFLTTVTYPTHTASLQ
jgi:uncharacterized protein YcbK (DUF882 family)